MKKIFFVLLIVITSIFLFSAGKTFADAEEESLLDAVLSISNSISDYSSKSISPNRYNILLSIQDVLSERELFDPIALNDLVSIFRKNGLFLQVYKLNNIDDFSSLTTPFVVYLGGEGFCVVNSISEFKVNKTFVNYTSYKNKQDRKVELKNFLKKWKGIFFSPPMENVFLQRVKKVKPPVTNEFVVIYTHHYKADFGKMVEILEGLREKANNRGWKLIYVDELGLIPKETVERRMKRLNISEEEAFNQIKESIFREDEMLSKGIPITAVNTPLYRKLYKYLAKHKITSFVEDLDYELWKKIVSFDDEKLYQKAALNFMKANIRKYLENIEIYTQFFYEYNVYVRDRQFALQIKKLLEKNPKTIIFTIRGLAHYGLGEKIDYPYSTVRTAILCRGKLYENFNRRTWIMTLWNNDVRYPPKVEEIEMAKVFIQDCIFNMVRRERKVSILEARRISYRTVNRMTKETILNLLDSVKLYNLLGLFKGEDDDLTIFAKVIYDWCKNKGFVEEF